jgi:adenylate cyclase
MSPKTLAARLKPLLRGRLDLRSGLLLGAASAAIVGGLVVYEASFFRSLERQTVDARFDHRGKLKPPRDIAIVAIDEPTFTALKKLQWPFPRRYHAEVIDRLKAAGAAVIAYDVQFTEPTDTEDDNKLIEAARRAGNVVLATDSVNAEGDTRVFGGREARRYARVTVGNTQLPLDSDGLTRRFVYSVNGLKSFAVAAADRYYGPPIEPSAFPEEQSWIDYLGPEGTVPTISFSRVLNDNFDRSLVRGKLVIVGVTAPNLHDVYPTPVTQTMSGTEIWANATSTLLRDFPLRDAPGELNIFLIVLLAILTPAIAFRRGPIPSGLAAAVLAAAFVYATQLAFDHGTIVAFVAPATALAISTLGTLVAQSIIAATERQRVRELFARFVPEEWVDQVLAQTGSDLRLGGTRVIATVMFADLRGFTTYSQDIAAEQVIAILNRFLGGMSEAILAHGGTLTTYMGDGLMAIFGAPKPLDQPDHADRAFKAAREMLEQKLPKFQSWLSEQGLGTLQMGIGLNTGLVMAGNVGHSRRVEYTAVGDPVNAASRIESMTKELGYPLLLSDWTHQLLSPDRPKLVCVGDQPLRGREGQTRLWGYRPAMAADANPADPTTEVDREQDAVVASPATGQGAWAR